MILWCWVGELSPTFGCKKKRHLFISIESVLLKTEVNQSFAVFLICCLVDSAMSCRWRRFDSACRSIRVSGVTLLNDPT